MAERTAIWRLKAGADRRFRSGHPWVYSNELDSSPKGIRPGDPVELRDASGKFLARGYGNPVSLIAFRTVSRNPDEVQPTSPQAVLARLRRARALREAVGLSRSSHRLCFGEADGLPGLIINHYVRAQGARPIFVVQAHTAGADRMLAFLPEVLTELERQCAVVIRNDVGVRKLEGLTEEAPRAIGVQEAELRDVAILVRSLEFHADLLEGQKTGFFLDQAGNVELAVSRFRDLAVARSRERPVRILDLCSYVGQWGTQLSRAFGGKCEVTAVDSSAAALEFARVNVEAQGAAFTPLKGDVLRDLPSLPDRGFDFVVCDPPALIKGRKDLPAGKHAYLQLNTQAVRLVATDGVLITCSCSALLEEADFAAALAKAARRNGRALRFVARGGHSPDHPFLAEFPEGRYLKCWMGMSVDRSGEEAVS